MRKVAVLGGDPRMRYLVRLLKSDGWDVDACPEAERVVLPLPSVREGRLSGTDVPMAELWPRLTGARRVYAAALPPEELSRVEALGIRVTDYYADEALAVRNAVPTAEGALAVAMERLSVTLWGTPCLVLGFGRIGKLLSLRLAALGARVTVAARKGADLAWAEALNLDPLPFGKLSGALGQYRAVFNTVPAPVLSEELLRQLTAGCLLVELASRPGFDPDAAASLGLDPVKAAGLPGKTAPETAARAIRDTLYHIWKEEEP